LVPSILAAGVERLPRDAIRWLLALIREQLALFTFLAVLVGIGWLLAGRGLRGRQRVRWYLVPLLAAVAFVCIVGPDRLFPKHPFEGPSLIILSENHALTALDLPGFAAAIAAGVLALGEIRAWLRGQSGR
jgi:hypothetical protein